MKSKIPSFFKGKETPAEEKKEARAVKSGKISPAMYAKGEKSEGERDSKGALMAKAKAMKSGKLTPAAYAKGEAKKK
jgi:hypothetical protein